MRKFYFLAAFVIVIAAVYQCTAAPEEEAMIPAAADYTEGELMSFAEGLNQDIITVTHTENDDGKVECNETLLGFAGKTCYYFGIDGIITRITFALPPGTQWQEPANRISEQLGEASFTAAYENGGATAEWQKNEVLFSLTGDGKNITLTITNFYGQND